MSTFNASNPSKEKQKHISQQQPRTQSSQDTQSLQTDLASPPQPRVASFFPFMQLEQTSQLPILGLDIPPSPQPIPFQGSLGKPRSEVNLSGMLAGRQDLPSHPFGHSAMTSSQEPPSIAQALLHQYAQSMTNFQSQMQQVDAVADSIWPLFPSAAGGLFGGAMAAPTPFSGLNSPFEPTPLSLQALLDAHMDSTRALTAQVIPEHALGALQSYRRQQPTFGGSPPPALAAPLPEPMTTEQAEILHNINAEMMELQRNQALVKKEMDPMVKIESELPPIGSFSAQPEPFEAPIVNGLPSWFVAEVDLLEDVDVASLLKEFNVPNSGVVQSAAAAAAAPAAKSLLPPLPSSKSRSNLASDANAATCKVTNLPTSGSFDAKQALASFNDEIEGLPPLNFLMPREASTAPMGTLSRLPLPSQAPRTSFRRNSSVPNAAAAAVAATRVQPARGRKRRYNSEELPGGTGPNTPDQTPVLKKAHSTPRLRAPSRSTTTEREVRKRPCVQPVGPITAMLPQQSTSIFGGAETLVAQKCAHMFSKVLTLSDVGKLGRIVLPRVGAESYFPRTESRNGQVMAFYDTLGNTYEGVLKYWMNGRPANSKRMWLLDHCHDMIEGLHLEAGRQLDFYISEDGRYVVVPSDH